MPGQDGEALDRADQAEKASSRPANEIVRLEGEIAEAERLLDPPIPPQQSVANTAVGVADELGRLLLVFVGILVVLIVLAMTVTPWLWIGAAVWLALAIWTIATLARRRRSARSRDTGPRSLTGRSPT